MVFFLNPPDPSGLNNIAVKETLYERLYVVDYPGQLKGKRYFPGFISRFLDILFLRRLERLAGVRFDVLWNFENSRFYDMRFASNRLKIYHQVDLNQDFHVKLAASTADICFCTTDFILCRLAKYTERVYKIHHGVAGHAFLATPNISDNPRLTATLIGNLDIPYLDISLLRRLITLNPKILFNLIGSYSPSGSTFRALADLANVTFSGKVESEKLSDYISQSDLLLLCYQADKWKEQLASPHKMMEYFASGNLIVATYTDEYKDKRDLLLMANNSEEFLAAFSKAVNNLKFYNSPEHRERRISFARENTYLQQINRINDFLHKHYLPELL
jgi:hypothetical protein